MTVSETSDDEDSNNMDNSETNSDGGIPNQPVINDGNVANFDDITLPPCDGIIVNDDTFPWEPLLAHSHNNDDTYSELFSL